MGLPRHFHVQHETKSCPSVMKSEFYGPESHLAREMFVTV